MNIDFSGKTVLITGATSGIGKATASIFRSLGANLLLTGKTKENITALNKKLDLYNIINERYYHIEFKPGNSLNEFLNFIEKQKRIDVLINNAGINRNNLVTDVLTEDLDSILAINLRAPFLIAQSVARVMKRNNYGRIVNIASIWGIITREQRSVYSTVKSGLIGMNRSIAIDLAKHNILVNAVSPGFVKTDLTNRIMTDQEARGLAKQVPLSRFAEPEEIARTIVFFASELNSYITGQNIIIDGGFVSV